MFVTIVVVEDYARRVRFFAFVAPAYHRNAFQVRVGQCCCWCLPMLVGSGVRWNGDGCTRDKSLKRNRGLLGFHTISNFPSTGFPRCIARSTGEGLGECMWAWAAGTTAHLTLYPSARHETTLLTIGNHSPSHSAQSQIEHLARLPLTLTIFCISA